MCYVDWPKGMDLVTFVDSNVAVQLWISIILERKLTNKKREIFLHTKDIWPCCNGYQGMTCDVRLQLAEVRCAVASSNVRAEPILRVNCDVRAVHFKA